MGDSVAVAVGGTGVSVAAGSAVAVEGQVLPVAPELLSLVRRWLSAVPLLPCRQAAAATAVSVGAMLVWLPDRARCQNHRQDHHADD